MKRITFTITFEHISRKNAEKFLDAILALFEWAGFKLNIDFSASFHIDPLGKK